MHEEFDGPPASGAVSVRPSEAAIPISDVDPTAWASRPTGIGELDRVLGGGLVPGSVTLLGGEPGIGKSTLLLQLLASLARGGARCLLASGEESRQQVRLRAERLDALHPSLWLAAENNLASLFGHLDDVKPDVLVVDSIQTLADPALASSPGSVGQVRECANALVRMAKERDITVMLVGHVTKEGSLAGPRVLEHVVDTVLSFEGDRHHALRLLRAVKHRFGATGELGLFEMVEAGLIGVADPGAMFLGDRQHGASGSVVACTMEGQRPLLVETQALVTATTSPMPRRTATGVDSGRIALLLAVLAERAQTVLSFCDVFASVVGGVRLTEPAADLALALALASAHSEVPVPTDVVAIGEIGLAGEVRSVAHMNRRLAEATRLGFRTAIVPASTPDIEGPLTLLRVATLGEAVRQLHLKSSAGSKKSQRQSFNGGSGGRSAEGEGGGGYSSEAPWPRGVRGGGQSRSSDRYQQDFDRAEHDLFGPSGGISDDAF
jgi:DNA repair protein RadA/Sms